jgi:hypothetical protein
MELEAYVRLNYARSVSLSTHALRTDALIFGILFIGKLDGASGAFVGGGGGE